MDLVSLWSPLIDLQAPGHSGAHSLSSARDPMLSGVIDDWSLDGWNDAAGRTQDDTLQMLAHAQVSLKENPPPDIRWSLDA